MQLSQSVFYCQNGYAVEKERSPKWSSYCTTAPCRQEVLGVPERKGLYRLVPPIGETGECMTILPLDDCSIKCLTRTWRGVIPCSCLKSR
jgi:hypothetical protein